MSTVKIQSVVDINAGNEIGQKFAMACRENYLGKVAENVVSAENCPEMVVFDLQKLRSYLDKVEKEFTDMQVPAGSRGVAIMPMIYAGEKKFNVMFVPCTQEENGELIHPLSKNEAPNALFDDWFPPIWNHGSGI
jgi:hypothetical protein